MTEIIATMTMTETPIQKNYTNNNHSENTQEEYHSRNTENTIAQEGP